ncbi:methionine ABC transporter ATP-binding protein [Bifidobacterium eulemuris]|uniref:ATP-binding cassette domain-containing protein n=1 Tax=Bifidobacterium eulemuris TaxID=1765219 RepID=A0A261G7Z4_9BIFI|nr:ATP-binding cassette domain-containing protein [Bifidobacterium eulemuris]OZG67305.1 methionine ABC transporter ATP-binding protein [Bifidobacterium eulemuris]QOL32888.1 ATP-binding cassette domain-containing protein [Bifidobacterium eulemuris]
MSEPTSFTPPEPVVAIKGLKKTYHGEDGDKTALHDIDLTVDKGDIYGIIGLSGAGKSTLVRCINGLEKYDEGSLVVLGEEVGELSTKELRALRRDIGMIFQSFNLMPSRTVAGNVELPLLDTGADKAARAARVEELLDLVDLRDKADAYPSELSGGQKQRVAIARALANNPSILLSDEATSALDPNTTKSILKLLRRLHDTLGLTVIIITHQMSVIKQVCNKVAVIDQGTIVERGKVFDIFVNPKAPLTRSFVATTSNLDKINDLIEEGSSLVRLDENETLLRMRYVSKEVSQALVSGISRIFDIDVNIIFGDIDVIDDAPLGGLVVVLRGDAARTKAAIGYLKDRNIGIEVLQQ